MNDKPTETTYASDMDDIIACAACGKLLKFGDSYTSRKILSNGGFGFAVCEDCYEKEFENDYTNRIRLH